MLYLLFDIWYRYLPYYTITWYLTPVLAMLYLTHDTQHRYFPCYIWPMIPNTGYLSCYTWHLISDNGTCHAIFDIWYLKLVLAMLYLTLDIRHRYLPCYTWHMLPDTGTCHAIFDPWYPTPVLAMLNTGYLTSLLAMLITCIDTGTCHAILITWYAFMWYKYIDFTSWPLTGHYHPWYRYIIWHIHNYHFYGDLAWLLYYYQTFGTPELLYTWTPEIRRLLILLLILYSCWSP